MPLDPRYAGTAPAPIVVDNWQPVGGREAMPHEEAAVANKIDNYSTFKRIARGWKSGALQIESGLQDYDIMEADQPTPEMLKEREALEAELTELGQDGTGFASYAAKSARLMGQWYGLATAPFQQASRLGREYDELEPSTEFAKRVGTVAQGVVQPTVGIITNSYRSAAGNSYMQSIKQGVDPNVARLTAHVTGALIASVDAAGAVGAGAPLAIGAKNLIKSQIARVATSPKILQMAGRVAAAYGAPIAAEVPTEMFQEAIQIAAEEVGKNLTSEDLEAITADEIYARIEGAGVETLKSMLLLSLPGGSTQVAVEAGRLREARRLRTVLDESKKALDEGADPIVAATQFVEAMDEAEVKEFFISADAIVEAAQKSGDPGAFYAELGVTSQIEEAALLGGDVRMDVPRGVALMQSEQWDLLKDHIRLTHESMSPFEEAEQKAELETEITEAETAAGETGLEQVPDSVIKTAQETVVDPETKTVAITLSLDETKLLSGFGINVDSTGRIDEAGLQALQEEGTRRGAKKEEQPDEQLFGLQGFFKDAKDAGMTDKQYETYLTSLQKAADSKNSAKERIRLRKLERETREEIKTIKAQLAEVARESVDNQPVYGAINALEGRERLNKEKLESLGIDPASLPKARGRQIYEKGGTVDPELFAELYGFEGADIMAFSMMDAIPREQAIQQETERMFNEQYVGLTQKQQEIEADIEALHNDSQATVLAMELNQLREAIGQKKVKPRLMKVAARDRLRDFPLKEIKPNKYLAAERREARTAARLLRKGDRAGAAKAKFRQLLNFQFAMEAYRVREKSKSQHKYLRKFLRRGKPNARLPIDYLTAIQTMLGDVDLKRARPTLVDFVASKQLNEGIVLNIPMQVQVDNGKTNYLDLTLRRWEQMVETVKEVEKKGLDENKLLREQEKQTRDEKAKGLAENVLANLKDVGKETVIPTRWEKVVRNGRDLALNMINVETIARTIDGFKELGEAHNAIVKPYFDAMINGYQPGQIGYIPRHKKEAQRMNALNDMFTKKEQRDMKKTITIPGVTSNYGRMSHEWVLMTLLNVGNLENRKALVDGGTFTEAEIDIIINHASKKDWDYVQAVLDYFEEFWPEVVESSKRRRNVVPEKVAATPIETPHGTYRGGYFPLMYDFDEVTMTRAALESDVAKLVESQKLGGYVQTQTQHGHTLNREDNAKRKVRLDLFNITAHVNQVIYDLEVGDAAMDIYKMLYHPEVTAAFRSIGQHQRWEQLSVWFGDLVLGEKHFQDIVSRTFRRIRTGFTISIIGFKGTTVLLQLTGLSNTMVQVGKMNTLMGLRSAFFNPQAAWYASTATPFMEQRSADYNYDIAQAEQAFRDSFVKRIPYAEKLGALAFYALIKLQKFVDTITFISAQRKGMIDFNGDLDKANEFADNMVARSQSSGVFGLRTPLERGTTARRYQQNEVVKALIPFMSYFLAKANIAYERAAKTNKRSPPQVLHLILDLVLLTIPEQLIAAWMMGDWPDDEDDYPAFAAWTIAKGASSMMPGVRDMVSAAEGFTPGGVHASVLDQAGNFLTQLSQGEIDAALIKSGVRLTGIGARIPGTSQAIATGSAVAEGSENPWDYIRGPQQ